MNRDDWLWVGCKILGVYFGVSGLIQLVYLVVLQVQSTIQNADTSMGIWDGRFSLRLYNMTQVIVYLIVYLIVGYVLTRRTEWCVKKLSPERAEQP